MRMAYSNPDGIALLSLQFEGGLVSHFINVNLPPTKKRKTGLIVLLTDNATRRSSVQYIKSPPHLCFLHFILHQGLVATVLAWSTFTLHLVLVPPQNSFSLVNIMLKVQIWHLHRPRKWLKWPHDDSYGLFWQHQVKCNELTFHAYLGCENDSHGIIAYCFRHQPSRAARMLFLNSSPLIVLMPAIGFCT